ncbi:MAG: hypothetical protein EBS82_04420 [Methylocystaceae bacterium]|nr:hypothetical protein [Methylocystaceae bacterium]
MWHFRHAFASNKIGGLLFVDLECLCKLVLFRIKSDWFNLRRSVLTTAQKLRKLALGRLLKNMIGSKN